MKILTEIARLMKAEAGTRKGIARHRLSRGLNLTLSIQADKTTLSLTRWAVRPSPKEEAICRAAFDVPRRAIRTTDQKQGWFITRLTWSDARPAAAGQRPVPPTQLSLIA